MSARGIAVAATLVALALPASAAAHAYVVRSDPVEGSRLAAGPHEIRLWFNEAVAQRFRSVRLVGPSGRDVRVRLGGPGGASSSLVVEVPRLRRGTYALAWRVLAENDGHTTSGALVFGVGPGAAIAGRHVAAAPPPKAIDVALRWLRFALAAQLLGGIALLMLARRPLPVVERAAVAAGVGALLVQLVVLARQADVVGASWAAARGLVLDSRWGTLWLAQTALLAALCTLALRRPLRPVVVWLAAVGFAVAEALGSHAAGSGGALAVAADVGHVLAACVWIGAVASLALATWRDGGTLARELRGPFALLAGGSAFVVVLTGLYAAGVSVASVDGLLTTLYGRTLLVKTALAAAAGALGAANFLLLRRRRLSRGVIAVEALAGAGALLAAAVLASSAPARGPQFAPPRPLASASLSRAVADLVVTTTVRPNRAGSNVITVVAASTRRPPPAAVASVRVRVDDAEPVVLRRVEGQTWLASAVLPRAGESRMTVAIRRGGRELRLPVRWRVEQADPARAVVYSSRPLAPIVDAVAALLLLAACVGVVVAGVPALIPVRRTEELQ